MNQYWDKLQYVLVDGQYIQQADFEEAVAAARERDRDPVDYLIEHKYISEDLFGQALAEAHGVAYADLNSRMPSAEQILRIPEATAREYRTVLFDEGKKDVTIATDRPDREGMVTSLQEFFPKKNIHLAFSLTPDVNAALDAYREDLAELVADIITQGEQIAPRIIDALLREARIERASDIHIEPHNDEVHVRFRIDGLLQDQVVVERGVYETIVNRIKVLSQLRIDTHKSMQDGSIRYSIDDRELDLRVSIVPTLYGEKVVLRVLGSYLKSFSLSELGLNDAHQEVLTAAARKPFGMIINTGPTGSGKTTTLYAIMRLLNTTDVNITTIEDPVEYRVAGLNQIQVDHERGITFSRGLRSIVRQDPDVVLVGEIRDDETAEIAVNAALTGHTLLSTFHANDAATAIPRLLDMNIEPFLLASTLDLVMAQRLVRKICENCKYSVEYPTKEIQEQLGGFKLPRKKMVTLYEGKGCAACMHTGYSGQTAIFEYIQITPEMKDCILTNPSAGDVWELARSQGSASLFEDGVQKVREGITTVDELLRVATPPQYGNQET